MAEPNRKSGWRTLQNWLLIRHGEGSMVLHLAIVAMFVGGGLAIGRGSSDALFFKRFGIQYLPHMFFATSVLLMLASVLYAQVADKWRPGKLLLVMSAVIAGLLLASWSLMQFSTSPYAYVVYFLIYAVASEILLLHFSYYAGSFYDVQQGKRLFPLVNAASRLGAIIGGLMLGGLVHIWPATSLALVWMFSLLLIVATILWKARRSEGLISGPKTRSVHSGNGMLGALFFAKRSKLLRVTGVGAFLLILLVSMQDYIVATLLTRHFEREQDLTAFFGWFFALSNALVLALQMLVTNRLLHRYGLRAVNMIFPWSTLATFGLLALVPGVATATLARFNYMGMLPAFRIPAANLFYKALPLYMQGRARALILGLVLPAGLAVAGLGLMWVPLDRVDSWLPVVGVVLSIGFVAIKLRKNAAYSESLTELIRQQVFTEKSLFSEQDIGMDRQVAEKIAASILQAPDDAAALVFVDVLCEHAPQEAGRLLLEIAPGTSIKVQDYLLRRLARLKPDGWLDYARARLYHQDQHLSSTALEVLGKVKDGAALVAARVWQTHENPRPRSAALVVLKNMGDMREREIARAKLLGMLGTDLPQENVAAKNIAAENIAAVQAVMAFGDGSMIAALQPLLNTQSGRVRASAVYAYAGLKQSQEQDCGEVVKAALNDHDEAVRIAAVKRLSSVQEGALRLDLLAQALEDSTPAVRREATSSAFALLPESAAGLAEAFAGHFHHFDMQTLLAGASKNLAIADREWLLDAFIRRHLDEARQKRQLAAQLKVSDRMSLAVTQVLQSALQEEAHRHVCVATDLFAERNPCEAMYQVAGALRSQECSIRAQGLESLQCLGDNAQARDIAAFVDQPEMKWHPAKGDADIILAALPHIARNATPWLRECIAAYLRKTQTNG